MRFSLRLIPTLALSVLLLGGATSLSAQGGEVSEVPPESAFFHVQRYAITYEEPRDIAEFYIREFRFKKYDAKIEEIRHPSDRSMRIVFITLNDIDDAAVQGVQLRLGLKFSEGQWQAVEAGMRRKCARGESAGEWTKSVCP